jgi:hypothetical protein
LKGGTTVGIEEWITVCAVLLCGYYGLLVTVFLLVLQRERSMLYKLLAGASLEKGGALKRKPLQDRLTELKKKWRAPAGASGKEGDV